MTRNVSLRLPNLSKYKLALATLKLFDMLDRRNTTDFGVYTDNTR